MNELLLRRRVAKSKGLPSNAVDLGLPSGKLWCTHNIGATNIEDVGMYFSYGNIEGHYFGDYNFSAANYQLTPGYGLTGNVPSNALYDAAIANLGSSWRLPTSDEFSELVNNTDHVWTTDFNGMYGIVYYKKSDHAIYTFFPAGGYINGTYRGNYNSGGDFWCSDGKYANHYKDNSGTHLQIAIKGSDGRLGMMIRPIMI